MKPSALVDTRVIYCGDNIDQLSRLPDACVDLVGVVEAANPRIDANGPALTSRHLWAASN